MVTATENVVMIDETFLMTYIMHPRKPQKFNGEH
ncbi:hypothetical protein CLV67_103343 [Actinoplanes italicus]|uniref:Uncharacterized protein n=1 Tax=Actinoplanes italicus TaxID=113567 RepID=A0A2T0KJA6_9ACTN|nr:hypothetical protein CLV67_103343 [Actinoplanes italicus]